MQTTELVCLPKLSTTNYNAFDCNGFYNTILGGGIIDTYNYLSITEVSVNGGTKT